MTVGREAGAAVAGERDFGQAGGDVLEDGVVCGGEADGAVIVDDEEDGHVLVAEGSPALGVAQGEIDSEVRGDPVVVETGTRMDWKVSPLGKARVEETLE